MSKEKDIYREDNKKDKRRMLHEQAEVAITLYRTQNPGRVNFS